MGLLKLKPNYVIDYAYSAMGALSGNTRPSVLPPNQKIGNALMEAVFRMLEGNWTITTVEIEIESDATPPWVLPLIIQALHLLPGGKVTKCTVDGVVLFGEGAWSPEQGVIMDRGANR